MNVVAELRISNLIKKNYVTYLWRNLLGIKVCAFNNTCWQEDYAFSQRYIFNDQIFWKCTHKCHVQQTSAEQNVNKI